VAALGEDIERKAELPFRRIIWDHNFRQQLERIVEGARLREADGTGQNPLQPGNVHIFVEGRCRARRCGSHDV